MPLISRWTALCLLLVTVPLAAQPRVEGLFVYQEEDTVVALYCLAGAGAEGADVKLEVSEDEGATWTAPAGVSGEVGPGVTNGTDKRAVWSLHASHPRGLHAYVRVRVETVAERAPAVLYTLTVRADTEGASVYVDDHRRGTVPLSERLAPGKHRVRVEKAGYLAYQKSVTLDRDRTVQARLGHVLTVRADTEGAGVYVDDRWRGPAPVSVPLPPGEHRVRVERAGYSAYQETVTLDRDRTVQARLGPPPVSVRVEALLKECETHFHAKRLVTGQPGTALACYREVLTLEPGNVQAEEGLEAIYRKYLEWMQRAWNRGEFDSYVTYARRALTTGETIVEYITLVNPGRPDLPAMRAQLATFRTVLQMLEDSP
jgi:hypothetical protein